jgi:hypothetical protein
MVSKYARLSLAVNFLSAALAFTYIIAVRFVLF